MLRADAIHPDLGGNKWYKLKRNLDACLRQGHRTLLTFGGAWSNHIHATAAACHAVGLDSIGVIRGEPINNSNLDFAHSKGMQLTFIDRQTYRDKHQRRVLDALHDRFGDFYPVPEGGSNALAVEGVSEMLGKVDTSASHILCACGTGTTLAGIILAAAEDCRVIGIPVLHASASIQRQIADIVGARTTRWRLQQGYEFGGYAKVDSSLLEFMVAFREQFGIELDAVYTAKMFYGLFDMIADGRFPQGSRIIAVHTGGLQGNDGFSDRLASVRPDHGGDTDSRFS